MSTWATVQFNSWKNGEVHHSGFLANPNIGQDEGTQTVSILQHTLEDMGGTVPHSGGMQKQSFDYGGYHYEWDGEWHSVSTPYSQHEHVYGYHKTAIQSRVGGIETNNNNPRAKRRRRRKKKWEDWIDENAEERHEDMAAERAPPFIFLSSYHWAPDGNPPC